MPEMQETSDFEIAAHQMRPFPLLKLPNELIENVARHLVQDTGPANPSNDINIFGIFGGLELADVRGDREARRSVDKEDIVAFSKTCKHLREIAKKFVFLDVQLLTSANVQDIERPDCARLAQWYPGFSPERLQTLLQVPPPDFLRHIQELAIHEFWKIDTIGNDAILYTFAVSIGQLLMKPKTLRRLEIDGSERLAQYMEEFLADADVRFPYLQELVASVEFRFLLKLAPNIEHFSNMPREGYDREFRNYGKQKVDELLQSCGALRKLRHLDFTIADFDRPFDVQLPALSLDTLKFTREREYMPSTLRRPHEYDDKLPMGLLLDVIGSQPGTRSITIPRARNIFLGADGSRKRWQEDQGWQNWLPAAILAVRFLDVEEITVGKYCKFSLWRNLNSSTITLQRVFLDHPNVVSEEYDIHVVYEGADGAPAWIVYENDEAASIAVNADCRATDEYTT
ncbi:uncharacterized protein J3D65DRAFT_670608 [Phyllosticta citribraziliensis]|uniref:F-box domain-containing protein n=1 Tax=Phyllosticta citribraziliensis TaxID=989973 RepID=A0ABR1LDM9_9PEZI